MRTPEIAPPRDDLPWLRRRSLRTLVVGDVPAPSAPPPVAVSAPPAPAPPGPASPPEPSTSTSLDLGSSSSEQGLSSSEQRSTSLDLGSTSLDLSGTSAEPVADSAPSGAAPSRPSPPPPPGYRVRRVTGDVPVVLTAERPTVTLTRVQSGVGRLTITAATSVGDGDLRLGCAYRLRSGSSSLVQAVSQVTVAPPASRRPVVRATRERFEELHVDLRQVDQLDRMVVYLFSIYDATRVKPPGTKAMVPWAGVLSTDTFAGSRIDVPLRRDPGPGVFVVLSLYNVDGELVLRAENELLAGSVRDAVQAFGFDTITWIDPTTPLV